MGNRTRHTGKELVHGFRVQEHPSYRTWANMLSRCTNPNHHQFYLYGGRGITVCASWFHFKNFAEDMGLKPSPELTIERVENNLGYFPENCMWENRSNQCVNRRTFSNNTTGARGVIKDGASWVARFDYEKVRYNIGWFATLDEAIQARSMFVDMFFSDRQGAMALLPKDKARHTSKTGVRGVSPHTDGGFLVRVSVDGKRVYVGYFKTIEGACDARQDFITKQAS